jgi:hypothetical protein
MDRQPQRVRPLHIAGVATALGIFSSLQAYNYVNLLSERHQGYIVLLALNVTYWWAWAVLVPGILWLARRYRFGRHTWPRAAAAHAAGVVVATALHAALAISARVVLLPMLANRRADWWESFQELFFLNFDWEMMTYWSVVGLSHAMHFHRESQDRQLTAAQLETRLAEAQLQALQSQLHPHFLFNTLNTIAALMRRNVDAAEEMLERLSDLLRLTLDRIGTQQVRLKDELDFIEKYLDIERARFGDRLQVHVEVDPEVLDAAVPTLLLQPLVENAVDALEAFNTGVGLSNTRSRLQHLYGGRHRFDFQRPPGGGLEVTVVLPFVLARDLRSGTPMESVA